MTTAQIIEKNVACYNNRDIEGFMALFSNTIQFRNFSTGEITINGLDACRRFYEDLFERSPQLHSTIVNRICFDNKVIDQESITGRLGMDTPFEIVLIYEIENEKICTVTAIRK